MQHNTTVKDKINEIAREIYEIAGHTIRPGYDFFQAQNLEELTALDQALSAWKAIFGRDADLEATWSDWY